MRIFMLVYGTRGDVQPYLALATALDRAGHEVLLAGPAPFRSFVTGYGIRYTPLDTGMLRGFDSQEMRDAVGRNLKGLAAFKALRESAHKASQSIRPVLDAAWEAASRGFGGQGAELVIHHPLGFAGHHVAEKLGVPAVVGQIYPMFVPTREFANTAYHYRLFKHLPGPLNHASYALFRRMLQVFAGKEIDNWRRDSLGLAPRARHHDPLCRPDGGPAAVLNAVSPQVVRTPRDYPDSVHTTGFWNLPSPAGWEPPPRLAAFLAAGPPPVYLGFGSLVGDPTRSGRIAVDAIRVAGVRAVLATGRGGLETTDAPDGVFVLDQAPHDWLLPRMAAVVHHAGGTTVEAARAGRPQVVCPFVIDQVFWADRMHRLGVAPAPILQRKLTVDRLAAAIRTAVDEPGMARRASELADRVRSEDGPAEAVRVVESLPSSP